MVRHRKAQAAFEYLSTYGWAMLTALIAIGALAYFGFLNPTNLLPNKCDFGTQLECVDYMIESNGDISLMFRNNFGKGIDILRADGIEVLVQNVNADPGSPLTIPAGAKGELTMTLDTPYRRKAGEKQEVGLIINFTRSGGSYPTHNISGNVFVTVQ